MKTFAHPITFAMPLLFALPLLCSTTALAQQQTLTANPDASEVGIFLAATDHRTKGTFHVKSGTVGFDYAKTEMSGLIVVAAGSGKTGSGGRDKNMTNNVLEAAKFAEITFAPHSYKGTIAASGDSTVDVTGTFTLHGTPHEITVPMQIHIDGSSCKAKTHFMVPYVQWGLKDPSILFMKVDKIVAVDVTLDGKIS